MIIGIITGVVLITCATLILLMIYLEKLERKQEARDWHITQLSREMNKHKKQDQGTTRKAVIYHERRYQDKAFYKPDKKL